MFKRTKKSVVCMLIAIFMFGVTGCSSTKKSDTKRLLIAHAHAESFPVHIALSDLKDFVEEETDFSVEIYPNGQLGDNRDVIELVKGGVLDVAKVSASSLEQFNPAYSIFSLPYIFQDTDHYYDVMEKSNSVKEIFKSTKEDGFIAIGWYDSGARSIYSTKKGPVKSPKDLKGLKIRTQDSATSIDMIRNMGGSATPMSAGEVYTSLQQGVIDGAENNEGSLADGHGEVAKAYTYTQHQYAPDIIIISSKTWDSLSKDEQEKLMQGMNKSTKVQKKEWKKYITRSKELAQKMGVNFYNIDKTPFIDAVKPQLEKFRNSSKKMARYLDDFMSYSNK